MEGQKPFGIMLHESGNRAHEQGKCAKSSDDDSIGHGNFGKRKQEEKEPNEPIHTHLDHDS